MPGMGEERGETAILEREREQEEEREGSKGERKHCGWLTVKLSAFLGCMMKYNINVILLFIELYRGARCCTIGFVQSNPT